MTEIIKKQNGQRSIFDSLEAMKPQLARALPKHLTPDRMARLALTELRKTPALAKCTPTSVLGCIMTSSQLGLEIGSHLGHAYLIPFKDTCTLIIGYKGLIELARRSGEIATIQAHVVREQDGFSYSYGLSPTLEHTPVDSQGIGSPISHAYAVAKLSNGESQFDVMTLEEIEAIRKRSRAGKSGPWVTDFPEMAKKTVLRRLCKMLPMAVEAQRAIALDEMADANVAQDLEHEAEPVDVEMEMSDPLEPSSPAYELTAE